MGGVGIRLTLHGSSGCRAKLLQQRAGKKYQSTRDSPTREAERRTHRRGVGKREKKEIPLNDGKGAEFTEDHLPSAPMRC